MVIPEELVMIKELVPNFKKDSRQLIASKSITLFGLGVTLFFTMYSYFFNNSILLYVDLFLLLLLFITTLIMKKRNIYLLGKIALIIMLAGVFILIYANNGMGLVFAWSFIATKFIIIIFGYKRGLIYSFLFNIAIFVLMYKYIGEAITSSGYVRFISISITLTIIAFAYEYSIDNTIKRLHKIQANLEETIKIDSLTNIFNRRYFDTIFPQQIKISKRNNKYLALAMIDIDNFKSYNDTYGHQAGDEVLKSVAQSFKSSLKRPDDYVFRLGGEEFGVLYQLNKKENALVVANKICKNIERLKIAHSENSVSPFVTVSIGVHIVKPQDKHDCDDIYKIADDALYVAKQNGKNRVEEL